MPDVTIRELLDTLGYPGSDEHVVGTTTDIYEALWELAAFKLGQLQHGHPQSNAIVRLFARRERRNG